MSGSPHVSVIMPVYNGERYLKEAIESILSQTFDDFEFIIINDGSTDNTPAILRSYNDKRIILVNQEHQGLIVSLNRGLAIAQGEYVARMDADDISLPERLTRQVQYMEAHPEIGVLGTWIKYIDGNGVPRGDWRMPTSPSLIGWSLFFGTCLAHPSVMMRRDVIEQAGFYCPEALHAEDYDLWIRVSALTQIANIPEILLQRRVVEDSICSRHFQTQEQNVVKAMHSMITRFLGSEVSYEAVESLRQMAIGSPLVSLQQIETTADLVQQLYQAYFKAHSLNRMEAEEVARDAGRKLYILATSASKFSLWKGLVIFIQALRLNPRLLSARAITKGVSRLVGRI